jgi:type IV fimbrial biogenesis protein FimT
MSRTRKNRTPSVRQNVPFVCYIAVGCLPFVRQIIPSVRYKRNRGFTLTELIAVLGVAAILGFVAVPSMNQFVQSNRLTSLTNQLIADLNAARTEAIKRNGRTIACASTTGTSCSGNSNWHTGWVLFVDADESGGWNTGDIPIAYREAVPAGQTITNGPTNVIFNRQGEVISGIGTFAVCNAKLKKKRDIAINQIGRTSYVEGVC